MDADTLLPCPFCGGGAIAEWSEEVDTWAHFIRCRSCGAVGPWKHTAASAARWWNMRTLPAQPTETEAPPEAPVHIAANAASSLAAASLRRHLERGGTIHVPSFDTPEEQPIGVAGLTVKRGEFRFVDDTGILDDCRRAERYSAALREIAAWATEAYPVATFPDQDRQRAADVLADAGISFDALHGQWARHLTAGIGEIARKALEEGA